MTIKFFGTGDNPIAAQNDFNLFIRARQIKFMASSTSKTINPSLKRRH
jgi:hypothetical protein